MPSQLQQTIDDCHCFAARKTARRISRAYEAHLRSTGLTITQFLMMATLNEVGSSTVNDLAERLDIDRTAMGRMLGFLERGGHISIMQAPDDARSRIARLTDAGRELLQSAIPLWQNAQREFEAG